MIALLLLACTPEPTASPVLGVDYTLWVGVSAVVDEFGTSPLTAGVSVWGLTPNGSVDVSALRATFSDDEGDIETALVGPFEGGYLHGGGATRQRWSTDWRVHVELPDGTVAFDDLPVPAPAAFAIEPTPGALYGEHGEVVTWTPADEPDVWVDVRVSESSITEGFRAPRVPDDGWEAVDRLFLPDDTANYGTLFVSVTKYRDTDAGVPGLTGVRGTFERRTQIQAR